MKKFAVIVAGGTGNRMNNKIPKQFLLLKGKPVLYYTLQTFLQAYGDMQIILVLPEAHIAAGQQVIDTFFDNSRIQVTHGGQTRFHSVQKGLQLVKEESIVFVHDAVRCLVSVDLIHRCYETAVESGSAIPARDCKDSVRFISDAGHVAIARNSVKLIQTPQTFLSTILLPAYQVEYNDTFTDEATVVEAFGHQVKLVAGEDHNFKITTPVDLTIAEQLL